LDLREKGPIIGMVVAAAAAGGWLVYRAWPETLPNVVLEDDDGETIALDAMREGKDYLVLAFFLERCPISKFSVGLLQTEHQKWSERAAFVGLLVGSAAAATSYQEREEIDFPVYGLRSTADPFAVNELFEKVGSSYGTGSAIYGGTVVVVDADRTVVEILTQEDVKTLPAKLQSLLE
jgi:peroxiredoxin